jgi:LmbE family N-acetylglucosaminyl deacetylase
MTDFLFLSPHADDAVWSVGGLMHHLAAGGHRVRLVTLFSAQVLPLTGVALAWAQRSEAVPDEIARLRHAEDALAAEALGVSRQDAGLVDAASRPWYRRAGPVGGPRAALNPLDDACWAVERFLKRLLEESAEPILVSPSGFGGHVDHHATAGAAASLEAELGVRLWFYEEFPYVIKLPLGRVPQISAAMSV